MRSTDSFTAQRRRSQLIEAAISVIADQGYPAASIAKIAQHIGISKSVALYHFSTKDELVGAVVTKVFTVAAGVIVPAVAAAESAPEKLAAYVRANCMFLDRNRAETIALREIASSYRTADGKRFDVAVTEDTAAHPPQGDLALLDPVAIFEWGVENGQFRSDLDPISAASALRGALDGAATDLGRLETYDPIAFGEHLIGLILRGALP